jgi:protein TonB
MRKIYVLMAVAAIAMVGCKNNGGKKAAAPAEAEEAPAAVSESMYKAIEAIEAAEEVDAREAIEKLAAAQSEGLVESVAEILEKNPDAVIPFAAVENKPGFNGGDANDFSKWVSENIQYPQDAIDSKIEGRVILQFTVSKEGDVKDVEVLRGVNELLDAEAVRVVSASPKWEAGSQNGVPVAVKYTFPVIFRLN